MGSNTVTIIGAGLAGCEAAYQIAEKNIHVKLIDMKPEKMTEAHKYQGLAELVCSNSLKAERVDNASGLLKEELRLLGSLIIEAAEKTKIPAGGALAVDRNRFSDYITNRINSNKYIEYISREVTSIPENEKIIIATGPLTSEDMLLAISKITGEEYLHFYDAVSPIIEKDSINFDIAFFADRYDRGDRDYINCPMTKEMYISFYNELLNAEKIIMKEHDKKDVFEGCMPVEIMASRGIDTLRYGPMKPVGIKNPNGGQEYHAIVQLRRDNIEDTIYNIVGFQTNLKFNEQKRVFSMIPGLENARFARYGVMHKNTFINSPMLLDNTYRFRKNDNIYFAGQITGVEGYVESTASGMVAGINAAKDILGEERIVFGNDTAIGALSSYVSNSSIGRFQPMNINYGIISSDGINTRNKKDRKLEIAKRAISKINALKH